MSYSTSTVNWSKIRTLCTRMRRPCRSIELRFAYRQARGVIFARLAGYASRCIPGSATTSNPVDASCLFSSRSEGARARRRGLGILKSVCQHPCMSCL